ncbi:hypothetical protein [Vulcaniibacterium tengchongense]|uniref:Uncharacterized protein n=1 Tax=Vulcaniibacterium tengchongense TaxID=1273429 RepID=A0A3N4VP26_9GAMM|nr:hypothetical protein [Vulcaniibacterium tengchongense]RPE75520.1 hypothetical protein EDC50_2965 [Vulcaniibacterium tengchongense]
MSAPARSVPLPRRRTAAAPALAAGLVAGTLDIAFATAFWALRGVPPLRVPQGVAAGLLGPVAVAGGAATATLGLALHYLIATAMAAAYFAAARHLPPLRERPLAAGALYGLCLYATMTGLVVPLSAAPLPAADAAWTVASVCAHVLLVGLPIAGLARRWVRPAVPP